MILKEAIIPEVEQQWAIDEAYKWFKDGDDQRFEIDGRPGTGKTTIVKLIIEKLKIPMEDVLFVVFMGKAALQLRTKGLNAKTIHSVIYEYTDIPTGQGYDERGQPITKKGFIKKDQLPKNIRLIVVDEGGTVDKVKGMDLESFGVPIIVLGDLAQLPPVFGEPYFLRRPNVTLTKPMRQALDSPIIWLSNEVINGRSLVPGKYGDSEVILQEDIRPEHLCNADILISKSNRVRQEMNAYMRKYKQNIDVDAPIRVGDKVVCRTNMWDNIIRIGDMNMPLVNGMIGYVSGLDLSRTTSSTSCIDFRPEIGGLFDIYTGIQIDNHVFESPVTNRDLGMSYLPKFQLGHAITTYMSQGSEYDNVFYFYEPTCRKPNDPFTGITRAKKSVTVAI